MSVLQTTHNRHIADTLGLAGALLLNVCVMLGVTGILYILARQQNASRWMPEIFVAKAPLLAQFRWIYVWPGLCGLAVIIGLPYSLLYLSAAQVFVLFVGMQLLASLIWDVCVQRLPVTGTTLCAAGLTLTGMVMVNWT